MGMEEILSIILHSRTQVHVFHLQTKSFAEHKALGKYYEGIIDIADGLAESWQGKYGIISYKPVSGLEQYESKEQVLGYFDKILKIVSEKRKDIKESYIQNQIDNVEELIYSTKYLIKELQ
jgi:DNA-binding ferritin-like protein